MSYFVYNASGCLCTTKKELDDLNNSNSSAILTKSCTLNSRLGNSHPKYWDNGIISANCNGLENLGYEFYINYAVTTDLKKPFILSVAGLSFDENKIILEKASLCPNISSIELNLSCPNLDGVPLSYKLDEYNNYLNKLCWNDKPLGLKLPIYNTKYDIEKVSHIIVKHNINYITCSNSLVNGLVFGKDNKPVLSRYIGGIGGGDTMKAIVLGQIYQFRQYISDIEIIMCGGIRTPRDVKDGLLAGANKFQIGTNLLLNGTNIFDNFIL